MDLNTDIIFVLAIAGVALVLFASELLAPDVVALLVLVSLGLSGILDLPELFSGFGSPVVLTLVGIFILVSALRHTGLTASLAQLLLRATQGLNERSLVGLLALAAGIGSLMMNTIASTALIAPVGRQVSYRRNISPSRLMMPVAFGALLGGMATLLTTSNLLMAGLLTENGLPTLRLLDFLPVGGPIALIGVLYLTIFSPLLLPERSPADLWTALQQARHELTRTYALSKRLFEAYVTPESKLVGRTLIESDLGHLYGVTVAALIRGRQTFAPPGGNTHFQAGDVLLLSGRPDDIAAAAQDTGLTLSSQDEERNALLFASNTEMAEVSLSPRSTLVGQTLSEVNFREKYGLNVVAIWHEGRPIRSHLGEHRLALGDALLVQGQPDQLGVLSREPDFLVMTRLPEVPENTRLAWVAGLILVLFFLVVALNWLPVSLAALLAGIVVIITGCETVEQARSSIQWQVIFLIGGMLPLAKALGQTGATEWLTQEFPRLLEVGGPHLLLFVFFVLTTALTQITSGQAATLIIGPLAIATALHSDLNPQALAMAVGISASSAFLSPVGHPANLLVMGPGGYRFGDYAKLGFPLVILTGLGVVFLLPLVYPL
jgi:di/tricarboxylate transporter